MSKSKSPTNIVSVIESCLPRFFKNRIGKLGPARVFLTLINMNIFGQRGYRRVLGELKDGLQTQLGWLWEEKPSSAALCKARKKLTEAQCEQGFQAVYAACSLPRTHSEFVYKQMRIYAIDGTQLTLPDSDELRETFGLSSNGKHTGVPHAGLMLLWDVSAQQPVAHRLVPSRHNEKVEARFLFDYLPKKSLLITDRGIPSYEVIHDLLERKQRFLLRIARNKWKGVREFVESDEQDCPFNIPIPRKIKSAYPVMPETLTVRMLKVTLPNGETEVLITNLPKKSGHAYNELINLYMTRWRIETAFREMKIWHALEHFSAQHTRGIIQEVYAAFVFALLVSEMEACVRIEKKALIEDRSADGDTDEPLPDIRFNRLLIADAVVGIMLAATDGPKRVRAHVKRCIEYIWRNRERRRKRTAPRIRKRPLKGFNTAGKREKKG